MNIFLKLAGADKDIIEQCSMSEKIKVASLGSLILIPAVLGFCSMSYALSTITKGGYFYLLGGVVWFFVILLIDRFLIATLHKSKVHSSWSYFVALFSRLVFAVVIGIAVSHPFLMLWFDGAITERLTKDRQEEIQSYRDSSIVIKQRNNAELLSKKNQRDCLISILTAEQSGFKKEIDCDGKLYYSSGIPNCGSRCDEIKKQINTIAQDILTLEMGSIKVNTEIDSLTKLKVNETEEVFSFDYLKRVNALNKLAALDAQEGNHGVQFTSWFILLFFMFVDILPVVLKAILPYSEYEAIKDARLMKVLSEQAVNRELHQELSNSNYKIGLKEKMINDFTKDGLSSITNVSNNLISEMERERSRFNQSWKSISRDIKDSDDPMLGKVYGDYLINIKDAFQQSFSRVSSKFNDFLKNK